MQNAKTVVFPLDIAEVADSHTGARLAEAINDTLHEYSVEDKVSKVHLNVMGQQLTYEAL